MNRRKLTLKNPIAQGVRLDDVVERKCENCRFFDWANLLCKHRAPYLNHETGNAVWPTVAESDWCGQFKRLSF